MASMQNVVVNGLENHAPLANELAIILGTNVERLRKLHHYTKVRFSTMLGIGRPTLNRIERGVHNPRLSLICDLAEALEVDVHELFTPPT